jgi:DNA topoisomerase-1
VRPFKHQAGKQFHRRYAEIHSVGGNPNPERLFGGMALLQEIEGIEVRALGEAGLRRVSPEDLPIRRMGNAGKFRYRLNDGAVSRSSLSRIRALAIPPAWSDVRIAEDAQAHLQAVGRDEAGRLQYIYHADWEDVRSEIKLHRVLQLAKCLRKIRAAVSGDLAARSPNWPLAAAIRTIDLLHLRAGHEGYAGDEGGRGAATLLKRHLKFEGDTFRLRFRGKGGKLVDKVCGDEQLFSACKDLSQIRGARLFKINGEGGYRPITAMALNQYLAKIAGRSVSAKDFRTYYASSKAIEHLVREKPVSAAALKRSIAAAARDIASELGNTPAIVKKSYIHASVVEVFKDANTDLLAKVRKRRGLTRAESLLAGFLKQIATSNNRLTPRNGGQVSSGRRRVARPSERAERALEQ